MRLVQYNPSNKYGQAVLFAEFPLHNGQSILHEVNCKCYTYPMQQEGCGVHLFWCDTLAEATGMELTHAAASYLLDMSV